MVKILFKITKKFVVAAFLLYGYNLIAVNFNLLIPINLINVSSLVFLGTPGLIGLVIFKIFIL